MEMKEGGLLLADHPQSRDISFFYVGKGDLPKKRDGDLLIYIALDGRFSRENRCFFVVFDPLRF